MLRTNVKFAQHAFSIVWALAIAFSPFAIAWYYVVIFHQATFFDHVPVLSDSIDYWHEIKSFIDVGLDFGYYGYEESHAPIGRFGPHGPWYPIFLGIIGKFFGFSFHSIPFFQSAILSICLIIFMSVVKPSLSKLFFLLCFTITYPAFYFWIPFSMQESLHLAMGVALAGCFVGLYRKYTGDGISSGYWFFAFCLVLFATLMRFTWVLFFAPLFLVKARCTIKSVVGYLLLYGLLFVVVQFGAVSLVQARFPYFDSGIGQALHGDFLIFIERMRYNFNGLFRDLQHGIMGWMFVMRYQVLLLIPFVLLLTPFAASDHKVGRNASPSVKRILEILPAALLACTIAMLYLFYLCNDIFVFKHVVPVFVFAVYFSVVFVPIRWMWLLVLVNVLAFPSAVGFSNVAHFSSFDRSGSIKSKITDFSQQVEPYMIYSPGSSPWCNTLIISGYPSELLGIPPGIAFNFIRNYQEFVGPLRSLYLLAPLDADLSGLEGKADLEKIVSTSAGVLYRNRLAECGGKRVIED